MTYTKISNGNTKRICRSLIQILLAFVFSINFMTVSGQENRSAKNAVLGGWSAFINGELVTFVFENPVKGLDSFSHTFSGLELTGFDAGKSRVFSATREAGTLTFDGEFRGDTGVGSYSFNINGEFKRTLKNDGIDIDENEVIDFFLLDITKPYVNLLRQQGYQGIKKRELKQLAKYGIGKAKSNNKMMEWSSLPAKEDVVGKLSKELSTLTIEVAPLSNGIVESMKSNPVGIDTDYIKSFQNAGYNDIPSGTLRNFKSVGITPQYLKSFDAKGFNNISYENYFNFKIVGLTPEYIKSFESAGFQNISYDTLVNLKAAGVTAPAKENNGK